MTAFVACHSGKVFQYSFGEEISEALYVRYVQKFIADGFSEYEAQMQALERLKENHDIDFWEVE